MRKNLQFIWLSLFCLSSFISTAQNKYAVIVGINNYYSAPNQLSQFCLKGCVNDAVSIKSLLINRFGFAEKNIISLLNEKATQPALLAAFNEILGKTKAGDAVLFYYCGHGIWMYNDANNNDPIKQGYNQAICLSDLYAENRGCLVRDNTLKKIFNQFVDKEVVVTSLFDCCFSGNLAMDMLVNRHNNYYDPLSELSFSGKSIPFETTYFITRSFNPSVTLSIDDTAKIPRPSERKDSRFVSLSACADNEKAMEIYDEASLPHGAFTKALLSVYKENSVSLPLSQVFADIKNQLQTKQLLPQQPTLRLDSSRLNNNLIGIAPNNFTNTTTAQCIGKRGNSVLINAGTNAGFMQGNVLSTKSGATIKVTQVFADSAMATITNGASLITLNTVFTLTNGYTISQPLLKVYVPQSKYSSKEIAGFFNRKILPFTKEKRYRDYNNWDVGDVAFTYPLQDTMISRENLTMLREQPIIYIFLPMPANVATAIKQELGQNQNIQLVSSDTAANYVLYLNYANATDNTKAGFVFTFSPVIKYDVAPTGLHMFYADHVQVPSLSFTTNGVNALAKQVNTMLTPLLRATGTRWLNEYARE